MARTTGRGMPAFTRTLTSLAALGEEFGLGPGVDLDTVTPSDGAYGEDTSPAVVATSEPSETGGGPSLAEPPTDPSAILAGVKSLGSALAARRERDREERAAAFRELAGYDGLGEEMRALEAALGEARAIRAGFEDLLARPFDDPAWIYEAALRDDHARAVAEAREAEAGLARLIEEKRREAERFAARPVVARLLAERRGHEEAARAQENAAEANRQRSLALASAVSLRDAGSLQEARRALGSVCEGFPDDPEARSIMDSIDRAERTVKDAAAAATLAEARRLRRIDPDGAATLIALIDTTLLSAERMHEIAGVAADVARHRDLVNPRFLRGRAPNSLAIVAEQRGRWEVAVAVGQDPELRPGSVIAPQLATAARPLRRRK